eukprot:COSAG01_NODE_8182_length_2887_cov_4.576399_2_plen_98_part_00
MYGGFVANILTLVTQWSNSLSVVELSPYVPSESERGDARLYADNVQRLLADELGVPTVEWGSKECMAAYNVMSATHRRSATSEPTAIEESLAPREHS